MIYNTSRETSNKKRNTQQENHPTGRGPSNKKRNMQREDKHPTRREASKIRMPEEPEHFVQQEEYPPTLRSKVTGVWEVLSLSFYPMDSSVQWKVWGQVGPRMSLGSHPDKNLKTKIWQWFTIHQACRPSHKIIDFEIPWAPKMKQNGSEKRTAKKDAKQLT